MKGIAAPASPGIVEEARGPRGRGRWVALGVVAVVAAGAVGAWRAGVLAPAASPGAGELRAPATAVVTRQDLIAITPVAATLGYAGSYTVTGPGGGTAAGQGGTAAGQGGTAAGQGGTAAGPGGAAATGPGGGTLTWLPSPGQVIRQGQVLYRTGNGSPVVLLYGGVPDWRALGEGDTGQDVSQLNHDLVALGYASRADVAVLGWDYYSWQTACGVRVLEGRLGVAWPPGSLSLGQVVFEPRALRVAQVTGALGGPAGGPVLTATSDRQVVTIALDASQQSQVKAGDAVTVTLPDGSTTPGVVSSVGTVAATTTGSGGTPATTIPVTVTLADPGAAGTLDQAPVTVSITTGTARNVLAVPVGALLAQSSEGYDVEVAGPGSTRRYVPVSVGIFDDNSGLVQVTGALVPGQRVVVPAS